MGNHTGVAVAFGGHHGERKREYRLADWMVHVMMEIVDEEKLDKVAAYKMTDDQHKWLGQVACQYKTE